MTVVKSTRVERPDLCAWQNATLAKRNADVFRSISLQMIVVVVAGAFNPMLLNSAD